MIIRQFGAQQLSQQCGARQVLRPACDSRPPGRRDGDR